jgi:pimeloyl-ACP methyl ester carboxylesterase
VYASRFHWFGYGDCCLAVSEHYPRDGGAEEKLILFFLHGRYGQSEIWRPLTRHLASRFRCVEIDLPGFGRSLVPRDRGYSLLEHSLMLRAIVDRFVHPGARAVLVGHDVGGAIAQQCAIQSCRSLAALVLINTADLTREPESLSTGLFSLRARARLGQLLSAAGSRLAVEHEQLVVAAWENRESRSALARAFEAWQFTWPGAEERRALLEELRRLPVPVLLLWGALDPVNPPERGDELLRQLPDAYLFAHENCGHWPSLEAEEWVDQKIREFLFRLDATLQMANFG